MYKCGRLHTEATETEGETPRKRSEINGGNQNEFRNEI